MSAYVCIMSVEGTTATKMAYQPSEEVAQSHLLDHPEYTNAYCVPTPSFPEWRWVCDPVAKTITDRGPLTPEEIAAMEDAKKEAATDKIFASDKADKAIKAFAEVVLDEINLLRGEHSLPPRTADQLRAAVKSKL